MLNKTMLALVAVFAIGLTACGKDKKKQAESLKNEGDNNIQAVVETTNSLNSEHGIKLWGGGSWVSTESEANSYDWEKLTPTQRADVKQKLKTQRSRIGRILEIGRHENMQLSGADNLERVKENAGHWLDSLDYFERTGRRKAG